MKDAIRGFDFDDGSRRNRLAFATADGAVAGFERGNRGRGFVYI